MNIQSTQLPKPYFNSSLASPKGHSTFSEGSDNAVVKFVKEHPTRTLMDVFDAGIGASAAFGAELGAGNAVNFLAFGGAVVHGVSSFINVIQAIDLDTRGYAAEARQSGLTALGDGLSALGMGMAAGGLGPLSLGFLAAGTITSTLVAASS